MSERRQAGQYGVGSVCLVSHPPRITSYAHTAQGFLAEFFIDSLFAHRHWASASPAMGYLKESSVYSQNRTDGEEGRDISSQRSRYFIEYGVKAKKSNRAARKAPCQSFPLLKAEMRRRR
jgi:hypothetical protein